MLCSVALALCSTLCDPYLNLFRGIIPPLGGTLDFSPILAFVLLSVSATHTLLRQSGFWNSKQNLELTHQTHQTHQTSPSWGGGFSWGVCQAAPGCTKQQPSCIGQGPVL